METAVGTAAAVRVLIAPDKFKGTLTAAQVAETLAAGIRAGGRAWTVDCDLLPLADGGDGSVDAAVTAGFTPYPTTVAGPTGEKVEALVAFDGDTAVVEVANTCGLGVLAGGVLEPLRASSRGFGEAIRFALSLKPKRMVLAVGGSSSTDGGMGMLAALGYRFEDSAGRPLQGSGADLGRISRAMRAVGLPGLGDVEFVLASDVDNPLLGPNGAAAVFGPQKGAGADEIARLDQGLRGLVDALVAAGHADASALAECEGAGSAGGIGFACLLLGAKKVSGADFYLDLLNFEEHKERCDVAITGEGSIDGQTLAGKLPAAVARRVGERPLIAVAGRSTLSREQWSELGLAAVYTLADYTERDTSSDAVLSAEVLFEIGAEIGRELDGGLVGSWLAGSAARGS